jgi:general secretion pathway protein E
VNDSKKPDITLNFRSLINDLVADGRMSTDSADMLSLKTTTKEQLDWHPLERVAEEPILDIKNPGQHLDIETLTSWLCERSGQ